MNATSMQTNGCMPLAQEPGTPNAQLPPLFFAGTPGAGEGEVGVVMPLPGQVQSKLEQGVPRGGHLSFLRYPNHRLVFADFRKRQGRLGAQPGSFHQPDLAVVKTA
jgi:hypothetical protein